MLFSRQESGRPSELTEGVKPVGIDKTILEPSFTVVEILGRKETSKFPKYPAVIPLVEVNELGTVRELNTVRLVFVRGVVAKGTFKA